MAKSPKQKQKLLYIHKYLLENTDETHDVRTPAIIEYLEKQDIGAERKSIYDDINTLMDFGVDIIKKDGAKGGYCIGERAFELAEVKLLVDLVQSSKFITTKKSRELIKKLEGQVSKYDAKKLQRQVAVADRIKTDNESIYYNVDLIHEGIAEGKQIRFKYYDWSVDKSMKYRKNGDFYQVSPWLLTWNDENYYLVAYSQADQSMRHYRVDKMDKIEVVDLLRDGKEEFEKKDPSAYAKKTFGMFAGQERTISFLCDEKLIGVMIDRFGKEVAIRPYSEGKVKVRANIEVSQQFFGWLSSFGTSLQMVEPKDVVEEYKQYLSEILGGYQGV